MSRTIANGKKSSEWVFFEKGFVVPDYDNPVEPSRIRWRIFSCPCFGIYLHKWFKPDPRRTPHSHPWSFVSIILRGAYMEDRLLRRRSVRHINWINFVSRKRYHNVVKVEPGTLSLMLVGRDHGSWGYWGNGQHVDFKEHPHSAEFKAAIDKRAELIA